MRLKLFKLQKVVPGEEMGRGKLTQLPPKCEQTCLVNPHNASSSSNSAKQFHLRFFRFVQLLRVTNHVRPSKERAQVINIDCLEAIHLLEKK